ncbi:protein NRT1/ PTR FAMILY 2.9 [Beta vulgaris subsp. vulgaris]|uniref:protein NRT1/ PTR FAMILY 2.9 n=1 Tax=Beta vulgaris subsp. vulgaris TaxID=3555 RepID=UPI0020374F1A|nr:protein NRT1/ PTR FAMILY 2.9 [Beta vulgaris subsp. vulgaris]
MEDKKKIKYSGVKAMPFVIGNETFEKLGTIGTSHNLLVYLTTVFNMKSMTATNVLNIFNGSANLATLLGAYLCDTYFGRYKTLGFASVASFMGMLLLTLTAVISELQPPHCDTAENCIGPTTGQLAFLIGALAFLVIGAGGIRPCNLAFGADQFDPKTESGKRGISSFFNWYYFTLTFAVMVSVTIVVYVQTDISWGIGLAIPAVFMFISCALFFLGTRIYVMVKPQGSPLASLVQVIVAAIAKRQLELPEKPSFTLFDYVPDQSINSKLPHTDQFRCLDNAAIITNNDKINPEGSATDPWKLCSVQQVEQVKCVIRVFPIWVAGIIYNLSAVTMTNYTVFQALQSNRSLGTSNFKIPAASYSIFPMLAMTIWIPLYDRIIVPKLRKITGKDGGITVLQKMGIGLVLMVITLIACGLVEHMRRVIALTKPALGIDPKRGAISSLSAMWLVLPLTLSGLSEAFSMIGLVEFYYKQFPENMRSIGAAFLFCGLAGSNYLSSFIQSFVDKMSRGSKDGSWLKEDLNKGRLDYFYYLIAGLELVNLFYFLMCAKWYRYRETISSSLDESIEEKKSEIALV